MLAVVLDPRGGGLILTRLADASVGVAVAFIVAAVVFPPRPDRLVEQALAQVDTPSAERALGRARGLDQQLSELGEAIAVARETLVTHPRHARDRRRVADIREAAPHLPSVFWLGRARFAANPRARR